MGATFDICVKNSWCSVKFSQKSYELQFENNKAARYFAEEFKAAAEDFAENGADKKRRRSKIYLDTNTHILKANFDICNSKEEWVHSFWLASKKDACDFYDEMSRMIFIHQA